MSSVSSKTSSSNNNDDIRETRENYRKKEAEMVKKHNQEIASLNKRHSKEIDGMQKRNSDTLSNVREKTQDTISQRDVKFQKDIEDLRKMHAKQLEKLTAENQEKIDLTRKSSEDDQKLTKVGQDSRVSDLEKNFEREENSQSNQFSSDLQNVREDQKQSIDDTRKKLTTSHQKELDSLREGRNERVAELEEKNENTSKNLGQQLRDQESRHQSDKQRMANANMNNIRMRDEAHNSVQDHTREGFNEDLKDIRSKYAKTREDDLKAQSTIGDNFHTTVSDRIDNEVNHWKNELAEEKNKSVITNMKTKAEAKQEVQDTRNAYNDKFNYLEKARQDALNQNNEVTGKKIHDIRREYDKEMSQNSRYLMDQKTLTDTKNKEALEDMNQDFALRSKYQVDKTDARVDRIRENSENNEATLHDNFENNIAVQRDGFEDKKRELVYGLNKEHSESLRNIKAHAGEQETAHQQNLSTVIDKYEKRINDLQEQMIRERRMKDNHEKMAVKDVRHQADAELEAQRIKYEDKNRMLEASRDRDIKESNRRNQEKLDQVLSSMKKQT